MLTNGTGSTDLKEKPLVSVIIPTYNRAELLQEALESVYAQEEAGELFDMEVIVVDDASSDATPEVMRWSPKIRYVRLAANQGASAARNAGIRASTGKYVAFLDDDDLWLPHKLRMQVPVLETYSQVGVVYGQGIVKGVGSGEHLWPDARWGLSGTVFEAFLTQDTLDVFNIDTVLIRREAFERAGFFDESLKTMEHHDMCLRLAFYFPFVFIPGPVAIGRFSKKAKWFTNVMRGVYEQTYPYIVERALAMLPDTADYARVRRKARTGVFSIIADQRWWKGGVDQVRAHLLSTLQTYPSMVTESSVRENLGRVARELAGMSDTPIAAVRAFWAEVKAVTEGRGLRERLKMHRLMADVFMEAAFALRNRGSYRAAGFAAACAILHDPTQLSRRVMSKRYVRAVFARPRWDMVIAFLKRPL